MDIGVVGLPSSGKSTLFDLLTGGIDRNAAAARRGRARVGVARVPDPRLDRLAALFGPRKTTPATIRLVEGLGVGGERAEPVVADLRSLDVLLVVVRAFADAAIPHPVGSVDPERDLRRLEDELVLADQIVVERRLERLARELRTKRPPELVAERRLLERCLEALEAGRALRGERLDERERRLLGGFAFLSSKPLLAVLNVDEEAVGGAPEEAPAWEPWRERPETAVTSVCATLEQELVDLDPGDERELMAELGIGEPAINRVAREAYRLLGLITFFTVGEDECRAWSIPAGAPATVAARAIHSDIERGFIRAEVVPHDVLLELGSLADCRSRGVLRLEGKSYEVRDGDIVHFRFAV